MFSLRVLGAAELRTPTDALPEHTPPVVLLGAGKPLAVLAFLQAAPGQCASREQLIELLWADVDVDAARHTLRQTLWYIKRKVGTDLFTTSGDLVRLTATVSSDRDAFLAALDTGAPEQALPLYFGNYFPGFAAPGGAAFEQWADLERTRLRTLYLGAAGRVVRSRLQAGRAREALNVARTARDFTLELEAGWRMVFECHLAAEDLLGAKIELERLQRRVAAEELELEPATLTLIRQIEQGRPAVATRSTGTPAELPTLTSELVGRERAFAELVRGWEQSTTGITRHLHVTAPAGLGKTRLLDGLAARLRSQRGPKTRVITVRATPAERSLPYACAAQMVGALCSLRGAIAVSPDSASTLVALAPGASAFLSATPDRSNGDEALRRRALAVSELVAVVADDTPLALLIDDVHWMDAASRALIATLAERASPAKLLLVTAGRPADRFSELAPGATLLKLDPLTADDIGALVGSIARLPGDPWADSLPKQLRATTDGSPLLVLETLHLAIERGQLGLCDGEWICAQPESLAASLGAGRAMQQRVAALPPAARDTLLRLAVAGAPLPDEDLEAVLTTDGRESLALLETRGFVVRGHGITRPAHDEIASMVVDLSSNGDRIRAHGVVADFLVRTARHDRSHLSRAIWHRLRATDQAGAKRDFIELVKRSYAEGSPERIRQLAEEALGVDATPNEVDTLLRSLPRRLLIPWGRWRLVATGAAAVMMGVGFATRDQVPNVPAALSVSLGVVDERGGSQIVDINIDLDRLSAEDIVDASPTVQPLDASLPNGVVGVNGQFPDGSYLVQQVDGNTAPNSTAMNLARMTPSRRVLPLIGGPYDQASGIISPDGRFVAFMDRRYSLPNENAQIAILDIASGVHERLVRSEHSDIPGVWSPDGTRLAFHRSFDDRTTQQVCTVGSDGSGLRCVDSPGPFIIGAVASWRSDGVLLLTGEFRNTQTRGVMSLPVGGGPITLVDSGGVVYMPSPDGTAVLCECLVPGLPRATAVLFASATPNNKHLIRLAGRLVRTFTPNFGSWRVRSSYAATIHIAHIDSIGVGSRLQLRAYGFDERGNDIALSDRQWSSLDTSVASIDSIGQLIAHQEGTARIVAKAGRALADTLRLHVHAARTTDVLSERWTGSLTPRWLTFGTPAPLLRKSGVRPVLQMNGDRELASGVLTSATFDARRGLGTSVQFRIPITFSKWQFLHVLLDPVAPDSLLSRWVGRQQGLEDDRWQWRRSRTCQVVMPKQEGGPYRDLLALSVGGDVLRHWNAPPDFGNGAWHLVEVQVTPDGHCAFAMDGQLLGRSTSAILLDMPLRVMLSGASVNTSVEVGDVRVWRGVRMDGPFAFQSR